uniref:Uncharacterized protein n=1 Tax=viral metagenome TaxID=1070528 RepID=A0A6C0C3W4_9ZZZZ
MSKMEILLYFGGVFSALLHIHLQWCRLEKETMCFLATT